MGSRRDDDVERAEEQEDGEAGIVGGGGPAGTLPDRPGPDDEDSHLADTEHRER